ncbi:MAG: DUF3800 domain-containing protein [Candidatus Tenebribacter davisii]|nr:DUF3800 domain-containing protein [Candidatus Tenebribacter davisii]
MSKKIFIDESGGTTINSFERFYVITAIIIDNHLEDDISTAVSEYWNSLSTKNTVKSSTIGSNITRRKQILSQIHQIMNNYNINYYSMIIDKSSILENSPLNFKKVFYKYPHRLFYTKLLKNLYEYDVVIDKYGDELFMETSTKCFERELDCFKSHIFGSDENYSILHLSDIIAGSYRRYFEKKDSKDAIEIIGFPDIPFDVWPPVFLTNHQLSGNEKIDEQIASITLEAIQEFIETNNEVESDSVRQQFITLNHLLYEFYKNPNHSVYRTHLVNVLADNGFQINEQSLSNSILSNLRSKGIILMSTEKGIKIPVNIDDINEWLHRAESQIIPYLKKVTLAREKIQLKSGIDILDYYQSPEMKIILNSLKKAVKCENE